MLKLIEINQYNTKCDYSHTMLYSIDVYEVADRFR